MKHRLSIILIGLLMMSGCNSINDIKFIRKYPDSKEYIGFLKEFERQLLEKEELGYKFGWTLKVYCEDTEREGGFTAKAYIYKDKMRLDAIFEDNRKWTRIYDGKNYYEYVNGKKSTEFLERWGDSSPERPAICPILSKIRNFQDFYIDSANNEAFLDVLIDSKRNTIVFPLGEPEKFYTLYYNDDNKTVYKKEYGLNFTQIDDFILPEISISEIPISNWCNGGKRLVKKHNFNIDFDWKPDENTYQITETMRFIEDIE
jgi:hypothetical protein